MLSTPSVVHACSFAQRNMPMHEWSMSYRSPWYVKPRLPCWFESIVQPYYSDDDFISRFRVTREVFQLLVQKLSPHIQKQDTRMKKAITPEQKVAATLYCLASAASYKSTHDAMNSMSIPSVSRGVKLVCEAIVEHLAPEFIKFPSTPADLLRSAVAFNKIGRQGRRRMHDKGLVHAVAAIDGTHIPIKNPDVQSQARYNRKGWTSFNCHACCGPDGIFYDVVVGSPGSYHDSSIFKSTPLYRTMKAASGDMWWQCGTEVQGVRIPFSILADSAYACETHVIPAFRDSQTRDSAAAARFNTVHSKTRNVIERAFGRLKARWRILFKRSEIKEKTYTTIVSACFVLHNICESYKQPMPAADSTYWEMLKAYNVEWGFPERQNFDLNINSRFMDVNEEDILQYTALHPTTPARHARPRDAAAHGRDVRNALTLYLS